MSTTNATFAGAATLAIGAALLAEPRRATGPLGLSGREPAIRAIAISDLALAPGLLAGRPRWPWMLARAATNVPLVLYLHRVAPDAGAPRAVRALAAALAVATIADVASARSLRRAGR